MEEGRRGALGARRLFQMANREFEEAEEDSEDSGSAEDSPPSHSGYKSAGEAGPSQLRVRALGGDAACSSHNPEQAPPSSSITTEAAMAVEDVKHLMGEFGLDLATVTQAFLKNSGEVAAARSCLQTGQRPDGRPLWNRQDDVDLLKNKDGSRHKLEAKYGVENVNKRVVFRKS